MRLDGYEEQNQPAQPKMTSLPQIQQNLQEDTCNTSVTASNSSPPETATTKSELYLLPAPLLKFTVWDLSLTKLWERHKTGEFCLFNPEPHPSPLRAYFWFTGKCCILSVCEPHGNKACPCLWPNPCLPGWFLLTIGHGIDITPPETVLPELRAHQKSKALITPRFYNILVLSWEKKSFFWRYFQSSAGIRINWGT